MPLISTFGAGSGKGFGFASCSGPDYVEATGGNETITSGDYKIHVFTGDGTLCVTSRGKPAGSNTVDYMVVAGAGGSGTGTGGGGGAGGFRQSPGTASGSYNVSPLGTSPAVAIEVSKGGMPITVGAGGAAAPQSSPYRSSPGADSVFSNITSTGGGGGNYGDGNDPLGPGSNGGPGGSGGGAGRLNNNPGQGNTPPTNPPQGNNGGTGPFNTGAGGGGAGANASGKTGGAGVATEIAPSSYGQPSSGTYYFSGGGGGGSDQTGDPGGSGGVGGGGRGGNRQNSPIAGTAGTANTGGGGGARGLPSGPGTTGGSGIVVVRYKFQN